MCIRDSGQMTAGSWIYIGTQGIVQGTYETFAAVAHKRFGDTLAGTLTLTGGCGGMGGALPLGLEGNCAHVLPELLRRGIEVDIVTDQTSAHDPLSYLPLGVSVEEWHEYAERDPDGFTLRARESMARHVEAMVGFMDAGAEVFDYGNSIRKEAELGGYGRAWDFPGFVPA